MGKEAKQDQEGQVQDNKGKGYQVDPDEEVIPNEYEEPAEDKGEDKEKLDKEKEPEETPPEQVRNAVYFPYYTKLGKTKRHGDIAPVTFEYKPLTDTQKLEFYEAMMKMSDKDVSTMRKVGYKMLSKHIIKSSLMMPKDEKQEEFIPLEVSNPKLWKFVAPEVISDLLDTVTGDVLLPEGVRKNF